MTLAAGGQALIVVSCCVVTLPATWWQTVARTTAHVRGAVSKLKEHPMLKQWQWVIVTLAVVVLAGGRLVRAQEKTSLVQAIEAAQKEVPGGKVIEAGRETEKDAVLYEVVMLSGEVVKEIQIDAATGKVLRVKDEKADADEAEELAEIKQALGAVKISLTQALEAAAREVKDAKVVSVELGLEDGKPVYEVELLQGDKRMEILVDAVGGKVVKAEGAKKEHEGEQTEEAEEAHACAEGAKALAQAKVTLGQALETALKEGKGAKPFKADLEIEKGKTLFDIELLDGAKGPEMEIDALDGKLLKFESVEEQAKEDAEEGEQDGQEEQEEAREKAAAAKALRLAKITLAQAVETAVAQGPAGKAYRAEFKPEDGAPRYEVQVIAGDKCMEVAIDGVSGKVLEVEPKGSTATAATKEAGWRDTFAVDKANWADHGTNPYFMLEPGYRWRYKHGAEVLTITVLEETKLVDGVTTRVLEEREEKNGQPLEVSRNFFAVDKATGDVYYFGEEVDEYKDGKLASHEGAWLAGADGAKFGLIMPGKIVVGDKFYQEIAPKAAMDRAEIVSVDERMETPAGTYEKCLHLKETSPLEKGVSHKWYAPGVGLVKDDEFVLESIDKPKR
jgi:uncharacterized membrane protein YkoI